MNNEIININFNGITDYTEELNDFLYETVSLSISNSEYLYLGREKPFNQIFILSSVPSLTKVSFTVEYYNGNSWTEVLGLSDGTKKLTKDGFICWQEFDDNSVIEKSTVLGKEQFWIRIKPDSQLDITIQGIGVLFSEDKILFQSRPILDDNDYRQAVVSGDSTYTRVHLDVVDQIVQEIRNLGIIKYQSEYDPNRLRYYKSITQWDLLDLTEIKEAAKYLALSKIYYSLSDASGDKWQLEAERFKDEYTRNMDVAHLSLDRNNDGKLQHNENIKKIKSNRMER